MIDLPASGSFDHDGWWLYQTGGDASCAQFASAHESHHKQLQDSTSYGAVARLYHELAVGTGDERYRRLAGQLTKASEHVQEAFASWMPAMVLGWSRERIIANYPAYLPHYDAMDGIVSGIASPYVRFHAAHAVARACMQTTAIERVLEMGVCKFSFADLRQRELPDFRFAVVCRCPPQWDDCVFPSADDRLAWLTEAETLTPEMFNLDLEQLWNLVNEIMYNSVAAVIDGTTLDIEGHLARTPGLLTAAREVLEVLYLESGQRTRQLETRAVTLGSFEFETFSVAEPLPARLLPESTDPSLMAADLEQPHLFATLRPTKALFANYTLDDDIELPANLVSVCLRRTVLDSDNRRVVELLRVDEPSQALAGVDIPLIAVLACSVVDNSRLGWVAGERWRSTVFLLDIPLTPLLDTWLAYPGIQFRYVFLHSEIFGREVPYLVGKLDGPELPDFPLMLRLMSRPSVRRHKVALDLLYGDQGRVIEDKTFLPEPGGPLDLAIAHLIGEEVRFGLSLTARR